MGVVVVPYPPGIAELERRFGLVTNMMLLGIKEDAQEAWRKHVETGETLASLHHTRRGRKGKVWVHSPVWHFVEYGTSPHLIQSKAGPYAYPLRNPKKRFFAYPGIVWHPGNRAFAPMRSSAYRERDEFGYATSPRLWRP